MQSFAHVGLLKLRGKSQYNLELDGIHGDIPFVSANRSSRFLRYSISSTISLTTPSNFLISVSSPDRDSWFAIALTSGCEPGGMARIQICLLIVDGLCANVDVKVDSARHVVGHVNLDVCYGCRI